MQRELTFTYTNYSGATTIRRVLPVAIRFGTSPWHPEPCWLLRARDLDADEEREFDMRNIQPPNIETLRAALENVSQCFLHDVKEDGRTVDWRLAVTVNDLHARVDKLKSILYATSLITNQLGDPE